MDFTRNPAYEAIVPRPSAAEEAALEESIKRHGQLFPIILSRDPKTNKTFILDGYTRYNILKRLGIEPKTEYRSFETTEEIHFVISTNLFRRHLSDYQKVMLSRPLLDLEAKLAVKRKREGTLAPFGAKGKTSAKVARLVGVSPRTYERILFILDHGTDKEKESVASGRTKPSYAEKQIRKRNQIIEQCSFAPGKFSVVYIDPPWKYRNQVANSPSYNTLDTPEIISFADNNGRKITDLFADDCVVYMWTTGPKMEDSFTILRNWNLQFSTNIVWVKLRKDQIKFLNGYRTKSATEQLFIATKGNPPTPLPENIPPGLVFAESTRHSKKPDVFYDIIEAAHPNQNKIEIFARNTRKGWSVFGNPSEIIEKTDEQTSKQNTLDSHSKFSESDADQKFSKEHSAIKQSIKHVSILDATTVAQWDIDDYKQLTNWDEVEFDGWKLPGTDDAHYWCGQFVTMGCLNSDHPKHKECGGKVYVRRYQRHCYRKNCNKCYKRWIARQANTATKRVEEYQKQTGAAVTHVVLSISQNDSRASIKKLKQKARMILKEIGITSFALIFHPFRRKGLQWYASPHFHVIGTGKIPFGKIQKAFWKYGWFIKEKGNRNSVFSTFYYLMAHAGVKKGVHTLSWGGSLSYSKLRVPKTKKQNKCPLCEEPLVEIIHEDGGYFSKNEVFEGLMFSDGWHVVDAARESSFEPIKFDYSPIGVVNDAVRMLAECS